MQDPGYQPQPDPKHNLRRTDAEKGEPSLIAPDGLRDVKAGESLGPAPGQADARRKPAKDAPAGARQ
jgi:hypothetical protein